MRFHRLLPIVLLALVGCAGPPPAPPPAQAWDDPGFVTSGSWSMYYSVLPTRDLAPEVAREYGVTADSTHALVVVSLTRQDQQPPPRDAAVTMTAHTITGEARAVNVRRVEQGGAISWIGEFAVARREMLWFEATAKPDPQTPPIVAQFRRELYAD